MVTMDLVVMQILYHGTQAVNCVFTYVICVTKDLKTSKNIREENTTRSTTHDNKIALNTNTRKMLNRFLDQ